MQFYNFDSMWKEVQSGRVLRRIVREEGGRLVRKSWQVRHVLSQGEDWRVATAIDEDTMQPCTLKLLLKTDTLHKAQVVSQIRNQKKMSGKPNFVTLRAVYEDANMIYLAMEVWGVALEEVVSRRRVVTQREAQLIFCQLVDILQSLRAANISHGNIALQSVLLAQGHPNALQLTDFTHSHDLSADQALSDKNSCRAGSENQFRPKWALQGTLSGDQGQEENGKASKEINQYISPEEYFEEKGNRMGYQRDIWACGVLLFRLLTGLFPFTGQGGKLILNKIRFATFSFPSLDDARAALQDDPEMRVRSKAMGFLSAEWKQLLKRMLSVKSQRITLRELISHPFKLDYFRLKDIPDLRDSHPQLALLFPTQPNTKAALFKKSWNVNYQQEEEPQLDPQEETEIDLAFKRRKGNQSSQNKTVSRESVRTGTVFEKKAEEIGFVQTKNFRMHKTQFGFGDSTKSIENARHQTAGGKARRQKEMSIYTPLSAKTDASRMPQVVRQPPFLIKFRIFRKSGFLGYILNNSIGVVFQDGQHVVGHTKEELRYVEGRQEDSQILIDNADCLNKSAKQSIYKSHSRNMLRLRNNKEDSFKNNKPKPNFASEQVSAAHIDPPPPYPGASGTVSPNVKYTTSNMIDFRLKSDSLSREKLTAYLKVLQHFGERVVRGALDVWVDKYWRDGSIMVFLLNTGCWQVAFCEEKGFRIYAVDQFGLSWAKDPFSSDVLHKVRQIITKYEQVSIKMPKMQKSI